MAARSARPTSAARSARTPLKLRSAMTRLTTLSAWPWAAALSARALSRALSAWQRSTALAPLAPSGALTRRGRGGSRTRNSCGRTTVSRPVTEGSVPCTEIMSRTRSALVCRANSMRESESRRPRDRGREPWFHRRWRNGVPFPPWVPRRRSVRRHDSELPTGRRVRSPRQRCGSCFGDPVDGPSAVVPYGDGSLYYRNDKPPFDGRRRFRTRCSRGVSTETLGVRRLILPVIRGPWVGVGTACWESTCARKRPRSPS